MVYTPVVEMSWREQLISSQGNFLEPFSPQTRTMLLLCSVWFSLNFPYRCSSFRFAGDKSSRRAQFKQNHASLFYMENGNALRFIRTQNESIKSIAKCSKTDESRKTLTKLAMKKCNWDTKKRRQQQWREKNWSQWTQTLMFALPLM